MLLKLIACNVFLREICLAVAESPHTIDLEFTELGEHVHPDVLNRKLQERIEAAASNSKSYEAILLGFGICGNAGVGLEARRVRLVMPRAHDCCTVLLGSREAFKAHFKDNPSMPFSSTGYMERGEYYLRREGEGTAVHYGDEYAAYVAQYGEENAKYLIETLHPTSHASAGNQAVFIDIPETAPLGAAERFRAKAEADGHRFVRLEGSLRLIRKLVRGEWDDDFLVVEPGQRVRGVYDWTEVVRAEPAG